MAGRFSLTMNGVITAETTATKPAGKTIFQCFALADLQAVVPWFGFMGQAPDGPKVRIQVAYAVPEFSAATAITPRGLDKFVEDHQAQAAAIVRGRQNASVGIAEPDYTAAEIVHDIPIHPQGYWVCPFPWDVPKNTALTVRMIVETSAVGVIGGFNGWRA